MSEHVEHSCFIKMPKKPAASAKAK